MEQVWTERFLDSERKTTDNSLVAERDKTNRSLERAQKNTESETDKLVENERVKIDSDLHTKRQAADVERRSQRTSDGYSLKDEKALNDCLLEKEREKSDLAVERERTRADDAKFQERVVKSEIAERLLTEERLLTDNSLQAERLRTDDKVGLTNQNLDLEIAAHVKTQASLTTRDEYIAIVSHDLRNPIGAASSCLEMMIDDPLIGSENPETLYWLKFAKRNVDASLRLITDLLDIERFDHGKLKIVFKNNNLSEIMHEVFETFVSLPAAKELRLRIFPPITTTTLECERDRISQVLSNLISNAIKFTPAGGTIALGATSNEQEVHVTVTDSGPGIPDNMRERIFDRFSQLGSADRRGLGLGLHISKAFVEAHGGKIWVEPAADHGSVFHLTLPRVHDLKLAAD